MLWKCTAQQTHLNVILLFIWPRFCIFSYFFCYFFSYSCLILPSIPFLLLVLLLIIIINNNIVVVIFNIVFFYSSPYDLLIRFPTLLPVGNPPVPNAVRSSPKPPSSRTQLLWNRPPPPPPPPHPVWLLQIPEVTQVWNLPLHFTALTPFFFHLSPQVLFFSKGYCVTPTPVFTQPGLFGVKKIKNKIGCLRPWVLQKVWVKGQVTVC